jgi:hypothetical protein
MKRKNVFFFILSPFFPSTRLMSFVSKKELLYILPFVDSANSKHCSIRYFCFFTVITSHFLFAHFSSFAFSPSFSTAGRHVSLCRVSSYAPENSGTPESIRHCRSHSTIQSTYGIHCERSYVAKFVTRSDISEQCSRGHRLNGDRCVK